MSSSPVVSGVKGRKIRVLGVDPAVAGATGYGVIELDGNRARLMRFGALRLPASATFAVRLREIHFLISGLVEQFTPDAVAVEMRGVVLLAAAQARIPAHSYSPREVKASVAGFGGASKQQIQQMVRSLLDLPVCPEPADASDALAVALCHAQASRARDRLSASFARRRVPASAGGNSRASRISIPRGR
jgi:crossover junction endodeoxyribonuclease RuvC